MFLKPKIYTKPYMKQKRKNVIMLMILLLSKKYIVIYNIYRQKTFKYAK